jgi:hypothetical protein
MIALMMDAARTSETSFDIQLRTWQYIPEDSVLQRPVNSLLRQSAEICEHRVKCS